MLYGNRVFNLRIELFLHHQATGMH